MTFSTLKMNLTAEKESWHKLSKGEEEPPTRKRGFLLPLNPTTSRQRLGARP